MATRMAPWEVMMGYGDGTVYQRGDGKWVASYEAGWTEAGKRRRRKLVAATKTEARRRLRDALRDLDDGRSGLDPKITIKQWCEQWLDAVRPQLRPRVHANYTSHVRRWIVPTIGNRRLRELTAADLRKIDRAVLAAGRSPTTARGVRVTLQSVLTDARAEGHMVPDAAFASAKPVNAPSDRQAMTVTEAVQLLLTASNRDHWPALPPDPTPITDQGTQLAGRLRTKAQRAAITAHRTLGVERKHAVATHPSRWLAALLQAMRQGECLGLGWDDVDLGRGLLRIQWELQEVSRADTIPAHLRARHLTGRYWLLPPKTRAGERIVPIVPMMHDTLTEWRAACPDSPHGLVWPRPDGSPQSPALDRLAWRGLQAVAGVQHPAGRPYLVHEARHTTATLLQAAGVTPEVIISIVGHASYASTQPYIHRDLSQARAALEAVAGMLSVPAELTSG